MKKTKVIISVLLVILISCLTAVAVSAAKYGNDPAEGMLWKITHSDGTVEYAEGFNEPFGDSYRTGDVFEFLPERYYLYHENFATIKTSVDITVDLSGSSIVCPETEADVSDINAQMFDISLSDGATVTFLMDGTEIYVPPHARTAFSVSGNGYICMEGGTEGGKIFAPGALNLTTNPTDATKCSYLKNIYCYKTSQNMDGLICATNTSVLKLIDSYATSENKSWVVFNLIKKGKIILNNTVAFNTAGSGLIKADNTGEPTVEINDGSYFYGASPIPSNINLKLSPESFYSDDISAYVGKDDVLKTDYIKQLFTLYSSSVAGEYTQKVADLTFYYVLADDMVTTEDKMLDSVWQLEKQDGTVEYTSDIYTPFRYAKDYKSFTLLCNVFLDKGLAAYIDGAFTLNLGSYNVFASEGSDIVCMLSFSGSGRLTCELGDSVIVLETATLIKADGQDTLTLNAGEAYVRSLTLIDAGAANVTLNGGFYEAIGGDGIATEGDVSLRSATLKGIGHGKMIDAKGRVIIFEETDVLASLGAYAVVSESELRLAKDTYIHGSVKAASIITEGAATFSSAPIGETDKMLVHDTFRRAYDIPLYGSNGIESKRVTYTFAYKLTELNKELYASFTFSSDVALNIYVPRYVAEANSDFTLRIVVDGLLYEGKSEDGESVVKGGRYYVRFSYNYIYPTSYSSSATVTLISGGFQSQTEARISELLQKTFDKTEDEAAKSVVASYIAYSMRASGLSLPQDGSVAELRSEYSSADASSDLMKYMSSVSIQPENREVTFKFKTELSGKFTVSYLYGAEQLKYEAQVSDGEMSIPVYRLNPKGPIDITYISDSEETAITVNMFDIINTVDKNSTSYEISSLYGAYLQSLYNACR